MVFKNVFYSGFDLDKRKRKWMGNKVKSKSKILVVYSEIGKAFCGNHNRS